MENNQKQLKKKAMKANGGPAAEQTQHESYLPPYLLINKNALLAATAKVKPPAGTQTDAYNERA